MTYQVLARKWRPREFASLIGQQAVVTALTNALREGRIAQAYLFSGIRGVGKTTAARLFAKALNCEKGPEVGPCNECATCREISAGADLDVIEIDAATYSKVEQVRELAESLKYGPARDRYKVVVLDEVHRLSRQAFDALLKIVEEPPPRLVFIFATTELDAVPATILSRCQEFHFRRVGAGELAAHLREIAAAEKIEASDRALALLARAGEGSVRDAVALLDQLATFGNGTIDEREAARLVGGLDLALFEELLDRILAGDSARVSALAREVEDQGWDPRQVHSHFLAYARDALHLALAGERAPQAALDLPAEEAAALARLAREAGYENLLRLLQHLLASEATVRRSDAAGLALELAWLKAAELPKLERIEELLARDGAGRAEPPPAPRPAPRAAAPERARPEGVRPDRVQDAPPPNRPVRLADRRPRPVAAPAPAAAPDPEPIAPVEPIAPEREEPPPPADPSPRPSPARADDDDPLARFRQELQARRPMLAAQLEQARLEWRDGELRVGLPPGDALAASQVNRASNRELLGATVAAIFGAGARWRVVERPSEPAPPPSAAAEAAAAAERERAVASAAGDARVQAVLDIFGGSVAAVESTGESAEPVAELAELRGASEEPEESE